MNKNRRSNIATLQEKIVAISESLENLIGDAEILMDEEQDAFDNMPESLQASERGEAVEAAADALSEAHDLLEQMRDQAAEVIDHLNTAAE